VARLAATPLARFNEFEVDATERELRRSGMLIALQDQAFDILVMFLRRPGEILSRAQIQDAFWPGEHGDLNGRLNFAIGQIRVALDDDADRPRYLATIRSKGYKFLVPVQWSEAEPARLIKQESFGRNASSPFRITDVAQAGDADAKRSYSPFILFALVLTVTVALTAVAFRNHNRAGVKSTSRDATRTVPTITSVTPIRPQRAQSIVISGRGFGTHTPYSNADSPYLAIRDTTGSWAAGRIIPENWDEVTLNVERWTDSQIVVTQFSGRYGLSGWQLNTGDDIEIAVWNPQTDTGPALYHLAVSPINPR
jgi:DNA-binding winged helix-turn-helix (wHTH) protein